MQKEISQTLNCMHDRQAVLCVSAHETGPGFFQIRDVAGTLRANTSCSHAPNVVLEDGNASHWDGPQHPHPTLGAIETGVGASNQEVFAQRGSMLVGSFMGGQGAKAGGLGYSEELPPTLIASQAPDIVCYEFNPTDARIKQTDISPTVLSRWGTGGNQVPLVNQFGFVRRLTTVECARLQGFPDHHTEIPWKKKPASQCPKGPQYKAYGNSMCVNVIEWLGKRIEKELNNPQPITVYQPEQMEFDL